MSGRTVHQVLFDLHRLYYVWSRDEELKRVLQELEALVRSLQKENDALNVEIWQSHDEMQEVRNLVPDDVLQRLFEEQGL